MTDHDVLVALVAFDVLVMGLLLLIAWKVAPLLSKDRADRARHARPRADAE